MFKKFKEDYTNPASNKSIMVKVVKQTNKDTISDMTGNKGEFIKGRCIWIRYYIIIEMSSAKDLVL